MGLHIDEVYRYLAARAVARLVASLVTGVGEMPELPEVETVRRGIEESLCGKTVTSVVVTGSRSVRRQSRPEFVGALTSRRLQVAGRRGKYLLIHLDNDAVLVVHLRMSGQLSYVDSPDAVLSDHTHVRIGLSDGGELRFVDPRTFGELFVTSDLGEDKIPSVLGHLGIDPLTDGLGPADFARIVKGRRRGLKSILLDQSLICGIGSIYSDEICFFARVRPDRAGETLTDDEIERLGIAANQVIQRAVEMRGSTLRDARYRDLFGETGSYQESHTVYGRTGLACKACGQPVIRLKVGGRYAHLCPRCQA